MGQERNDVLSARNAGFLYGQRSQRPDMPCGGHSAFPPAVEHWMASGAVLMVDGKPDKAVWNAFAGGYREGVEDAMLNVLFSPPPKSGEAQ